MKKEKLRIDKYLWCIRIFKTRSLAAEACESGKVRHEGEAVKASKNVKIGDRFEIRTSAKRWQIKVLALLYHRVAYKEAVGYYEDLTPPEELERIKFQAAVFHTGKRMSKIGRPSKKNKRDLDQFLDQ